MMRRPNTAELLPPYVSYSSWAKLLEALARSLPPTIDESYLASQGFSESNTRALRSALRFMDLLGTYDRPTERLERLVEALGAGGATRAEALKGIIVQAYRPLFTPDFNLKSATVAQLRLSFGTLGARGQIQQKCTSFFLNLARDAGLPLSPHLILRGRPAPSQRSAPSAEPRAAERQAPLPAREQRQWALASSGELGLLLGMFPKFDIDWPEEKKRRWFRDFAKLIRISEQENEAETG